METVLDGLPPEAVMNIEIKDFRARNRGLEEAVVGLVKAKGAEGRTIFSSYNPLALARLRRLDPAFYAAQLTAPGWLRVLRLAYLRLPIAVHPHFSEVTPAKLATWRTRGRRVIAWGACTLEELAGALRLDLDGIITDRPAEAVRMLRASP